MDTLKVKAFLLVAKYKNFSKVAQELSYTPSALSHIADSLEQELGVKLFIRSRTGVELTNEGEQLHEKFSAIFDAENALYKAASFLGQEKEHILRIGTFSSIALHILPGLLYSFKQEFPAVKTQILVGDSMQNWLENRVADIILADDTLALENYKPLVEDEYVAVVHKSEFVNRKVISIDELYGYSFINMSEAYLDKFLDYSRFKEVIPVSSIENDTVVYMVKEKIGVAVLPMLSMRNCPPGVKILKLKPKLLRTIGIAYNRKSCTWICEQFARHVGKAMEQIF